MSFFSGEYFYIVFTVVLLGALILGLLEKPLKWYNYLSTFCCTGFKRKYIFTNLLWRISFNGTDFCENL